MRCLELGCGTGEFTERLIASGCELVAVDLSEETAALARDRVGERARVVVGNIETGEGLEGLEFDAIVGVSVLHHVDLNATFAHTFSLLRPGDALRSASRTWRTRRSGRSETSSLFAGFDT